MCPHPGKLPGSLLGVTYSPWMAATNHQLAVPSSGRAIMARTPTAYQCRSALLNVPPEFQALLRIKFATFLPRRYMREGDGFMTSEPSELVEHSDRCRIRRSA